MRTKETKSAQPAPPPTVLQVLMSGIKQRQRVAIRYRDQGRARVIEPHAIYTDDNREVVADCFQIRGYSAAGRPVPFWRPFRVKKIAEAVLLEEPFEPRVEEGFTPDKPRYRAGLVAMVGTKSSAKASFVFNEGADLVGPAPRGRR